MRLVCGHMPALKAVQAKDSGMKVSSRLLAVVEKKGGVFEDGSARSTLRAVGKLPTCRDICARDLGSNPVCVAPVLVCWRRLGHPLFSDTIVTPFISDYLSGYLSLCPSPGDAVLSFGPMDTLLTPAQHYHPTRLYSLFPHPAQDAGEKRRYVAMLTSR